MRKFLTARFFSWRSSMCHPVRTAVGTSSTNCSSSQNRLQCPPHAGAACHNGMSFDRFPLPPRPEAAGGRGRGCRSRRLRKTSPYPRLRPGHRQPRSRPARVRPGLHRVRRPHGGELPDAAGSGPDQGSRRRPSRARREGIRRAAGGDRGVSGGWRAISGANMGKLPTLRSLVSLGL